jgi:hypothetical protein
MVVVNRFVLTADAPGTEEFAARAAEALAVLAARPGYVRGSCGRAYDDPSHWALVTEWESVGAYRRALGAFDVKLGATPLLAQSVDEPAAYETLARGEPGGRVISIRSDRADDPSGRLPAGQ